jgi:hypothetical protein
MSIDTAMERLKAANPAPDTRLLRAESEDLTALLTSTWQRSANMQTQQPHNTEPVHDRGNRGWVVAVAAATIVLVVVGIVSLLSTRAGIEPGNEVPVTTVTTPAETVTTVASAPLPPKTVQIEAFDFGLE